MWAWWEQLSTLSRFFYYIAIPSTVVLFLQSALTLIGFGLDGGGDLDADGSFDFGDIPDGDADFDLDGHMHFDGAGHETLTDAADFRFISLRGIIAFTTMFGWIGAALAGTRLPIILIMFFAFLAGLFAMTLIALLFFGISKLQSNGNIDYRRSIGKEAVVYIPIPAKETGFGKIQYTVQERLIEVNAVTEDLETIGTNELVRIVDIRNLTTMVVERT